MLADCEAQLQANAKLKDFSRIPKGKPTPSASRLWTWAAAVVLLLPVIALTVTELAGVTHLFRGQQTDPTKSGGGPTPIPVAKQQPQLPTFKNSIGMEFVTVPKGTGWLGGGDGRQGETKVEFKEDFYLGMYEVTQGEWEAIMGVNPCHFSRNGNGNHAVEHIRDADLKRFPVESVSWDDCQLFIEKLNEKEKQSGWVYRLPKESEWEYACRGGPVDKLDSAFDYHFAKPTNTLLPKQANFNFVVGRTCQVGSYEPNSLGLHDMHGNVHEFCDEATTNATGAPVRVIRGGYWSIDSPRCRAASTYATAPSFQSFQNLGLRLARVPSGTPPL